MNNLVNSTAMVGCNRKHITHYTCTPVRILEKDGSKVLVAPLTAGPTWNEKWIPVNLLHDIRPQK